MPLQELNLAVLTHPEKGEQPDTDENGHFHNYLTSLEERTFATVELTHDRHAVDAYVYLSLNLDINYIKQVSRAAYGACENGFSC